MRRCLAPAALLGLVLLAAPPALAQEPGAQIGGVVSSTLSLELAQSGPVVRALVTTTEPGSSLSVVPSSSRSGLSATVAGPFAPLDPRFGLTLVAWDDVLARRLTTIRLKTTSPAASTVLVTLSAQTP